MNAQELKKAQQAITDAIYAHAIELGYDNNVIEPITDGICDFEGYLKSKPKVMWILKEPNGQFSNGEIEGGGWSIVEDSFRNDIDGVVKQPTWQKIIYIMYGYLNGCKYEDMDLIRSNHEMAKVMQSIAYLNVSKMPGQRQSSPENIEWCYQQWKPILQKQIETYAPDVIIFGNTFEHFRGDFEKNGLEELDGYPGWIEIYKSEGRLLFSAYHPLQRGGDRGYIDTLIDALNNYFPRNK
jgi:hypothetical protein